MSKRARSPEAAGCCSPDSNFGITLSGPDDTAIEDTPATKSGAGNTDLPTVKKPRVSPTEPKVDAPEAATGANGLEQGSGKSNSTQQCLAPTLVTKSPAQESPTAESPRVVNPVPASVETNPETKAPKKLPVGLPPLKNSFKRPITSNSGKTKPLSTSPAGLGGALLPSKKLRVGSSSKEAAAAPVQSSLSQPLGMNMKSPFAANFTSGDPILPAKPVSRAPSAADAVKVNKMREESDDSGDLVNVGDNKGEDATRRSNRISESSQREGCKQRSFQPVAVQAKLEPQDIGSCRPSTRLQRGTLKSNGIPDWVARAVNAPVVNNELLTVAIKALPDAAGASLLNVGATTKTRKDGTNSDSEDDEEEEEQEPLQKRSNGFNRPGGAKAKPLSGWEAVHLVASSGNNKDTKAFHDCETLGDAIQLGLRKQKEIQRASNAEGIAARRRLGSSSVSEAAPASLLRNGFGMSEFAARMSAVAAAELENSSGVAAGQQTLLERTMRVMKTFDASEKKKETKSSGTAATGAASGCTTKIGVPQQLAAGRALTGKLVAYLGGTGSIKFINTDAGISSLPTIAGGGRGSRGNRVGRGSRGGRGGSRNRANSSRLQPSSSMLPPPPPRRAPVASAIPTVWPRSALQPPKNVEVTRAMSLGAVAKEKLFNGSGLDMKNWEKLIAQSLK